MPASTPIDPAHNPKVAGSNPAPAIEADQGVGLARALQTGRLRPRRPPQGGHRREGYGAAKVPIGFRLRVLRPRAPVGS
jgi:hypothetical protein